MGKAIAEIYQALQGTQEGGYGCLAVGFTTKLIEVFMRYSMSPCSGSTL